MTASNIQNGIFTNLKIMKNQGTESNLYPF